MKTKLTRYIFIVGFFFVYNSQAQNYIPFVYDNTSFFQFSDKIEALSETPGAFVPDPRGYAINLLQGWNPAVSSCNPHDGVTWAGPKFTNGSTPNTYYFYNKNNEVLTFKPTKNVGEAWTLYTYSNGNYIEATISNKELLTFVELTDSVKTISLQLKNSSGTALTAPVNSVTYQVSKNYGFIRMTRFKDFPTATAIGTLIGTTAPKKGFQMISSRDIFKFDIGDQFHYDSLYENTFTHTTVSCKIMHTVSGIYHSVNTDTVIYTIEQQKEIRTLNTETLQESYSYTTSTLKEKYILSKTQLFPEQANLGVETFIKNSSYSLTLFAGDTDRSEWSTPPEWFMINPTQPQCWSEGYADPVITYSYLEGCGLLKQDRHFWSSTGAYKHLVYFKKGEKRWGDALVITSSPTKKENAEVSLFPNPLKQGEQLHYNLGNFNATVVTIYNATGNSVSIPGYSSSTVDVSNLTTGLYIIQFINEQNESVSSKLFIK